jgi:hypothetical protein
MDLYMLELELVPALLPAVLVLRTCYWNFWPGL